MGKTAFKQLSNFKDVWLYRSWGSQKGNLWKFARYRTLKVFEVEEFVMAQSLRFLSYGICSISIFLLRYVDKAMAMFYFN